MFRWITGRGATRREVAREVARITPAMWRHALHAHPFLAGLSGPQEEALRERTAWILASKTFNGAQGMQINDDIMMSIAIQAALPVMALDPAIYDGWHEIVVYPGGFLISRTDIDDSGVVHEYVQEAAGEAWDGGPVILSWEDAGPAGAEPGANVVIHEFAHKLDLHAGDADGVPSLAAHPAMSRREWNRVLQACLEQFQQAVASAEDAIPRHIDPESQAAAPWYDSLALDPYAATDPAEFFAVSSESFFVEPHRLAGALPQWYGLLAAYYRQDPLLRLRS